MRFLTSAFALSGSTSQHSVNVMHNMRPNPSIEGTSNIRLRLLLAAPHVKR
jgi:hypothetical protein